jgi:hypothetical protein
MDTYSGRLASDGYGNLIADEGPRAGEQVAYDEGQYIFVASGEPSHFDRHHQNYTEATGTVDESMTDDPDLVNANEDDNLHHFGTQPDDPHYDEDAPNNTRVKFDDDRVAAKVTGHTEAYKS